MGPTPPRTPTARKSPSASPSATIPKVTALSPPIFIQKREWQGDNVSLPLQGLTQPEDVGESAPVAQMIPAKRRRPDDEIKLELATSPLTQSFAQNPAVFPSRPPQRYPYTLLDAYANDRYQKLLMAAIQSNQNLLPTNPLTVIVDSPHMDRCTNAMWQVAFSHVATMRDITAKVAMFSTLKLRALARLNYLPRLWTPEARALVNMAYLPPNQYALADLTVRVEVLSDDLKKSFANEEEWEKAKEELDLWRFSRDLVKARKEGWGQWKGVRYRM
ncbi:hypothetical protein N0V95_000672 [Ascochyta clinopodiicola]|nr:hypothetical protein N0V95_000672 [Ascochyta clinopodiicola]